MIKPLSQLDPRWSADKIGATNLTIFHNGCTLTCVSMASEYFDGFKTPGELARTLTYTSEGLLVWQSIEKVLPFKFFQRFFSNDGNVIEEALNNPAKVCFLQVNGDHWVTALRKKSAGVYEIADPLGGMIANSNKYARITGGAVMMGKAPEAKPSVWAAESWKWCHDNGLITGSDPQAEITAEQLAVILDRFHKKFP